MRFVLLSIELVASGIFFRSVVKVGGQLLMAMENRTSLEAVNGSDHGCGDGLVMVGDFKESKDLENVLLEGGLDSYLEDINDRLTILRMVSDSVIKGVVNGVEQEAIEKISQKLLELARLKKTLHIYHVGLDGSESSGSVVMQHEPGTAECGPYLCFSDATIGCDWIGESLGSLNKVVKEQLKNLRKEIDHISGNSSIRTMGSRTEMVGLSGLSQDKVSDIKWMDVDETLDSLKTTLDTTFKQVDNLVNLSKTLCCRWQQEKEFQGQIEDMMIMNFIRSLKEEYEEKLWDQNARLYSNESINWLEKFKETSSSCQEFDAFPKSLIVTEIGHITSHGSAEVTYHTLNETMQEVYEILSSEAAQNAEPTAKCEIEDASLESIMMQELCGVIFREALKEAEKKFTDLSRKYINKEEIRASTEIEAQQKERVLKLEVGEKERLKQEMLLLTKALTDFEYRVVEDINNGNLRLDNLNSQLVAVRKMG